MNCKYCGSPNLIRRGKSDHGDTRYHCKKCHRWGQAGNPRQPRTAKILLLDIETLPGEYYAFQPKVEYLAPIMQIKPWSIACWSAKWLLEPTIMGQVVSPQEAFDRTQDSILGGIWKLMNEAQIVITQNGINFDLKKLNSKFLEAKMIPPSKFLNVDTLQVAKHQFGWDYNRLDELGQKFGIGKKLDMSFIDWKNCLSNDKAAKQALDHMLTYCKQDIAPLLEDVYMNMLPYINGHPNLNVFTIHDQDVCPKCESNQLVWSGEVPYATPSGIWEAFRCQACGSTGRGTKKEHKIKSVSIR